MKNFKLILLLFAVALFSLPAMAQDAKTEVKETVTEKAPKKLSARKMAKQTASAVTELTEKQQKMILNYSRNLAKVDVKKEMKKTLKKMSAEDRQKVLGYITKVKASGNKPMANVKDVKPAAPTALKANDKTNKAKSKVDKSKQPKYVMKDKAVDPSTMTSLEILDKTFDFGTIQQGEKASTVYRVKNTGNNPLKISKAKGSCGCTVPQWPKEAIAPGEIAEIKVVFNSTRKKGKQNKRITITANTDPAQSYMTITGMVEVPAAPKKQ
ncbi:MAG: hypothetical protein ACI8YQ_001950 [Polaribacter sp.]|jgi:hypothetical protein